MSAIAELDAANRASVPKRLRSKMRLVSANVSRDDNLAEQRPPEAEAIEALRQLDGPTPTAFCFRGLDLERRPDLIEAYRRLGYAPDRDPLVQLMVDAGVKPMAGGSPVGVSGMGFQHNVPEPGTFVEDSDAFFQNTERNDIPGQTQTWPGLGGQGTDVRIPQVGLLAAIRILFTGSLVIAGGGSVTATYQWPHNLFKRVALNVNGQTGVIGVEGADLRARRQRTYRNPRDQVIAGPAIDVNTAAYAAGYSPVGDPAPGVIANGTYSVQLVYDIPITHDDYNLIGALYAQSDSNAFLWRFEPAAAADLFTLAGGSTAVLTGSIAWTFTIYDIPEADTERGRMVLLPSMQWLHGMLGYNQAFTNTGEVTVALIRTAGQLLATYVYMDSGGNAVLDPVSASEIRFQYGGNRRPRVFNPPVILIEKNAHDYNGRILRAMGYFVLDNEVDNPVRDLVYPKGITEAGVVVVIPTTVTLGSNPRGHAVEETMFPGR
jgi:hypothetical protein